jgi:hypothetical protein
MMILRSLDEWQRAVHGLHGAEKISQPTGYPCLAAFLDLRVQTVCCYVYPSSARRLLQAVAESPDGGNAAAAFVDNPTDEDWKRQISAVIFAMVSELIDVGALKPDKLERTLVSKLAAMDQWIADRDARILGELPESGHALLQTMYPPNTSGD